jgi:riboflavin kinase/FMN adenylyltransferase
MVTLGPSVVAIGVFDGVHLGHRALLEDTVAHARRVHARAVALTFDRDPDQVVTPQTAAPQLLTLDDKIDEITSVGIDTVLVVPFTPEVAAYDPETFLDAVLQRSCEVVAVHVGEDFRFGHDAAGDLDTLYVWGVEHNIDVVPHALVESQGGPVTSTRIRGLISVGDVETAAELLGGLPRITGTVVRGRGEGAQIGFPTANVRPVAFAALPADGVYAGRVVRSSGERWPAAISVGTPPTFPAARDYVEAHLIGFDGDLYGEPVRLEFGAKLRDQMRFDSVDRLSEAIRADVAAAVERVGAEVTTEVRVNAAGPEPVFYFDQDAAVVDDPEALEAAERAVAGLEPADVYAAFDDTWVEVLEPRTLGGLMSSGGVSAFLLTSPLTAAGIPFAWQPFPPEEQQGARPDFNFWLRFSLWVPSEYAGEARDLLGSDE